MTDINSAMQDLDRATSETRLLQAQLNRVRNESSDARARDLIDYVSRELDRRFGEFTSQYKQVIHDLQAKETRVQQQIINAKAQVAQTKRNLAAAKKAGGKVPTPAQDEEADIDPKLGGQLRDELLDLYGSSAAGEMPEDTTLGEIWEDWDWQQWENN